MMGRPDYILVNSEKPRDAAMRNTGTGFVMLSHRSLYNTCICLVERDVLVKLHDNCWRFQEGFCDGLAAVSSAALADCTDVACVCGLGGGCKHLPTRTFV